MVGATGRGSWAEEERSSGAGVMEDLGERDWDSLNTSVGVEAKGSGGVKNEGVTGGEDVLGLVVRCERLRARHEADVSFDAWRR